MFNKKEKETILNLAKCLIENQKDTNKQLKELSDNLNGGIGHLTLNGSGPTIVSRLDEITTNIYNKEETVDVINKEYTYRKDYERVYNENSDLLAFITTFCKYNNKYEVIELFDKIKHIYNIEKIEN